MLLFGLFTLLTAAALPSISVTPTHLVRSATLVLFSAAALASNALNSPAMGSGVSLFSGTLQATNITGACDVFLCIIGAIIAGFVWAPQKAPMAKSSSVSITVPTIAEYSVILLFTTLGSAVLISSTSFVTLYLGIELQSFSVYILAAIYRDSETASSAALKYFFIGGLSSAFILMGGAVVYWNTGTLDTWHVLSLFHSVDSGHVRDYHAATLLGLEAILLGILMKVAAAPFYNWSPDVYDGVPTVVTTWLTLMPKIALLTYILHLSEGLGSQFTLPVTWVTILAASSLLSLIVGTVVGLAQVRIKRLLAYSTISHVGFLLLALSVGTEAGVDAFTFYLFQYTITTLNAFLILLAFGYSVRLWSDDGRAHGTDFELNADLAGQYAVNPALGLSFSACLFSMAGVPPLVGFFGKQAVLSAALQSGYGFLAIVGIVTSVVSASYYLGLVRAVHFDLPTYPTKIRALSITPVHSYAIATLTLFLTLFILSPQIVLNSTSLLALAFHLG